MEQGKMAAAGKPVLANMTEVLSGKKQEAAAENVEVEKAETATAVEEKQPEGQKQQDAPNKTEVEQGAEAQEEKKQYQDLSDDEIKKIYEERFKTDTSKESQEETTEQKAKKEAEFEKRMLDLFIEGGGDIERFSTIKKVAQMDLAELSKSELTFELKQAGFTDDEINEIQAERYYQINPDELEQGFEESDEDFEKRKERIKRKVAYGTEKLTKRSAEQQKTAKSILDKLREAVEQKDLLAASEREYAAKVEKLSKEMPRKITLQLGQLNNADIAPIDFDVSEDDIASVVETLKDQAKVETIFYQENGDLNIEKISEMLLRNTILEKAAREALLEGQTRQTKIFEETFPARTPHELGVGGTSSPSNNGQKGKLASFGKPRVAQSADTRKPIK